MGGALEHATAVREFQAMAGLAKSAALRTQNAVAPAVRVRGFSTERERRMLMWTRRRAGAFACPNVFCHFAGQIFALAILVLWVTSALADPLTLRVVEARPAHTPGPSIIVRFDDDGRKALAQFTTEHVGEDIEFLVAGRLLTRVRLKTPILGGVLTIIGVFGANEIVDVANRLATDGRIEANAMGRP